MVVVESPRHYYRGNEFVYGVPEHHDNGRHRGWERGRGHGRHHGEQRNTNVVVSESTRRRW